MTVSKSIFSVGALAFAFMFGGGIYVISQLNNLAKPVAERIASETLGVAVTIGSLDISLQDKRASVNNITVANPDGFSKPHAITIDGASVTLTSIADGLVNFQDITTRGTKVYVEVQRNTTNLHALKAGIKPPKKPVEGQPVKPLKVIVQGFNMTQGQVFPSVTLVNAQDLEPAALSDIRMRGIGAAENGVPAREAVAVITKEILNTSIRTGMREGFYKGLSEDALKELGQRNLDQLKDDLSGQVEEIGEKINDMFGQ